MTFAIPDTAGTLAAGAFDVQYIWQTSTSDKWAEFMLVIACVAQLFCGLASVTSASRMMFAFSRDGAMPGHRLWRRLALRRVPAYAVAAICVLAWALMLPTLSNAAVGYLVGTSIAVIGLYIAFAFPIWLRWRAGDSFEHGVVVARQPLQVDRPARASLDRPDLHPVPRCRACRRASRGRRTSPGISRTTRRSPSAGRSSCSAAGGSSRRTRWFKGPISQGSEEELERIEAQLGASG